MNNLKNAWLPLYVRYEMEVQSLFNTWLVSGCEQKVFRLYFSCIYQREIVTETLTAAVTILLLKT